MKKSDMGKFLSALLFRALFLGLCAGAGGVMLNFARDPGQVRDTVYSLGPAGPLAFAGLVALQVVLAFIPGEPLELAAGYAWGACGGRAVCRLGCVAGSAAVFRLVRIFGGKALGLAGKDDIEKVPFLRERKKLSFLIIILFLLPGTPKDAMTWRAPLTGITLSKWLILSTLARLPSILTSTVSGSLAGRGQWGRACLVFGVTAAAALAGICIYNRASSGAEGGKI